MKNGGVDSIQQMRYVFVVNMQTLAKNSLDQYFTLCGEANILMSLYSLALWPTTNSSSYYKHKLPITVASISSRCDFSAAICNYFKF